MGNLPIVAVVRDEAQGGRLASNVRWLALAQVAAKLSAVAIVFLLVRYLGEAAFGRYAVALAIPMALEALADLGISQAMVRAGAGDPVRLRNDFAAAIVPKLVLGSGTVGLSLAIAWWLGFPPELLEVTVYLAIAKGLESLTYLARSIFQARERMGFEAVSVALDGVTRVAFVLYALASGFGLGGLAKALAVSAAVVLAATMLVAMRRFVDKFELRVTPRRSLALVATGLPLGIVWLLDVLPMRLDTILLGQLAGDRQAGLFAAATRLIEPATIIPYTMAAALLPLASRHIAEEMETLPALFRATVKLALAVAIGGVLMLVGLSGIVVRLLFGEPFSDAVPAVMVLAFALIPLFIDTLSTSFLLALYEQRALVLTQALGLAANLLVALLTVGTLGVVGVSAAVVVGESVSVIAAVLLVRRLRELAAPAILKVLLAGAPATVLLLAASGAGPLVATGGALLVYVGLLLRLNVFEAAERAYLRKGFRPFDGRATR